MHTHSGICPGSYTWVHFHHCCAHRAFHNASITQFNNVKSTHNGQPNTQLHMWHSVVMLIWWQDAVAYAAAAALPPLRPCSFNVNTCAYRTFAFFPPKHCCNGAMQSSISGASADDDERPAGKIRMLTQKQTKVLHVPTKTKGKKTYASCRVTEHDMMNTTTGE